MIELIELIFAIIGLLFVIATINLPITKHVERKLKELQND